jgi:hypothetical protein
MFCRLVFGPAQEAPRDRQISDVCSRSAGAHRSLLTLDTATTGNAEQLYFSLGYVAVGRIPRYSLNFDSSVLEATTVMYKELF